VSGDVRAPVGDQRPALAHNSPEVTSSTTTSRRDAIALIIGTVVNGLSVYGVAAVGTRTYGPEAFAPISVLWTFWAVAAAVLTFPLQHWVIHRIEVDGHEGGVRASYPAIGATVVLLAAVLGACAWLGRTQLFGDDRTLWPVLVALLTLVAAVTGTVRGVLAARRRFVATAVCIGGENLIRLVVGLVVVSLGGSVASYGVALLSGGLVVTFWPSAFKLRGPRIRVPLIGYLGGLAGGTVLAQVALTSGPAVLSAIGGGAVAVTGIFVTMALFRAPYLMSLGLANMVTGPLTALVVGGNRKKLRDLLIGTWVVTVVVSALGGGVAYAIGPELVELIFGQQTSPSRLVVAVIAAGSFMAVGTLGLTLMAAARTKTGLVAISWVVGLAVAAIVVIYLSSDPVAAVSAGFLAAQAAAMLGLAVFQLRVLR
jgi:O-antigen/teichoic acid export membrane protein